jgi:hypothetical protein
MRNLRNLRSKRARLDAAEEEMQKKLSDRNNYNIRLELKLNSTWIRQRISPSLSDAWLRESFMTENDKFYSRGREIVVFSMQTAPQSI